jgi:hypothetical protein
MKIVSRSLPETIEVVIGAGEDGREGVDVKAIIGRVLKGQQAHGQEIPGQFRNLADSHIFTV